MHRRSGPGGRAVARPEGSKAMNRQVVEIGQRFEQLGQWRRLWEVEAIDRDSPRFLHVTLREVTDPVNKRTLAPHVLFDRRRYRPVDPSERQPSGPPVRGRSGAQRRQAGRPAPAGQVQTSRQPASRFSMVIESRSANGYIMTCQGLNREHRFLVKDPGPVVECPLCGNSIRSMSLLLGQAVPPAPAPEGGDPHDGGSPEPPPKPAGQPGVLPFGPRTAGRRSH